MNSDLAKLQPYPFEKLNALKAAVSPPPHLTHISLSIGGPKHESPDFVKAAIEKFTQSGMAIVNLDCVILAERPKMAPHIESMRHQIAKLLQIDASRISIKAKTGEGVGEIGTGASIATRVVVLLAGL